MAQLIPEKLKHLSKFLVEAKKVQAWEPIVAYYCKKGGLDVIRPSPSEGVKLQ